MTLSTSLFALIITPKKRKKKLFNRLNPSEHERRRRRRPFTLLKKDPSHPHTHTYISFHSLRSAIFRKRHRDTLSLKTARKKRTHSPLPSYPSTEKYRAHETQTCTFTRWRLTAVEVLLLCSSFLYIRSRALCPYYA